MWTTTNISQHLPSQGHLIVSSQLVQVTYEVSNILEKAYPLMNCRLGNRKQREKSGPHYSESADIARGVKSGPHYSEWADIVRGVN